MSDLLNKIQDSFKEFTNNEYFYHTIIIGALVIGLFYYYFTYYSVASYASDSSKPKDISDCIAKFDTSQVYEFPNMLSDSECDKIIELKEGRIVNTYSYNDLKNNDFHCIHRIYYVY